MIFPAFSLEYRWIILGLSLDYPWIITWLSLDFPGINSRFSKDYPWLHLAISGYLFQVLNQQRAESKLLLFETLCFIYQQDS